MPSPMPVAHQACGKGAPEAVVLGATLKVTHTLGISIHLV
jgi:hypothetical protein